MKTLWMAVLLSLTSGCSSFGVRCDTRLHPINKPSASMETSAQKPPTAKAASGSAVKP
jgi:hypothetical protein